MTSTLVSIIITFYNQENYVIRTLQSVLEQTYQDWECIIVDDGSDDKSASLIKDFIKTDSRFKYLYQENQGVSAARNAGFKLASGNYINFLDGDDTFFPEKLSGQLALFLQDAEAGICVCNHRYYYETEKNYKYYEFEKLQEKPLKQLLFKWHNGLAFPFHAPLYKRSIWDDNELPFPKDYKGRCEDWVFNVIVALKDKKYIATNEVLCNYHLSSDNFTSDNLNLAAAAIKASIYLNELVPEEFQSNFIDHTIENSLKMYLKSEKINILQSSKNWRVANNISQPIMKLLSILKKS